MQVTLTQDVEGKKSGATATVTAERGAWLIANGYAAGDLDTALLTYAGDPTLASNREPADTPVDQLPKVENADNASEVNPEVAAFPADVDLSPRRDERKIEAPEVQYENEDRRPALNTPLPTISDPEPTSSGTNWTPSDVVPDTTNEWSEPDITPPQPVAAAGLPATLTRAEAGSHEEPSAAVAAEPEPEDSPANAGAEDDEESSS